MKSIFSLLICVVLFQVQAQDQLTTAQWQEDLKFLQHTVHSDYPFLFKKTTAEEFDAQAAQLSSAIPSMAEHEIVVGMMKLVSSFKYGHTALDSRHGPVASHRVPINLYHFKEGIFVQGIHKNYENALGAELIAVEGVPVEEALKKVYDVVPAENDQFFKAYGIHYLAIAEVLHAQRITPEFKTTITYTFEKDGIQFDLAIEGIKNMHQRPVSYGFAKTEGDWVALGMDGEMPLYMKNLDKIYYYEYLPEQRTVYVRQSQIQDDPSEDIPTFYNRVFDFIENNDVDKLILDVRLNGGGNNYKNKPVVTGIIETAKINEKGKFFVIIGRRTFSACQNLVNELDNYTNVVFIGEPTAENINFYGDNQKVELPNSKIPVYLSFAWWQDKPQWENGPWMAPHVAVDISFEDFMNRRDPSLDAALNYNDSDLILDPMQHFTDLFMAGEVEKLQEDAKSMVTDPRYRFFDFEDQFNRAGYNLLGGGQVQEAIFVFQLVAQLFPESANALDSLAEGYYKAGDLIKATELYQKAIEMDPDGSVGDNARAMLKEIQEKK